MAPAFATPCGLTFNAPLAVAVGSAMACYVLKQCIVHALASMASKAAKVLRWRLLEKYAVRNKKQNRLHHYPSLQHCLLTLKPL
uniref:Putative secreted peptide n=1 Tax=Anopheles braziliensis TaxID=58242 RepID=A0A2M3ZW15_9DIPT